MKLRKWWLSLKDKFLAARIVEIANEEELPSRMPKRNLILVIEHKEHWCVGMTCPCGCKQRIELPLIREASPRWRLEVDKNNNPTLSPSIWLNSGCRSHFFVRAGRVIWV